MRKSRLSPVLTAPAAALLLLLLALGAVASGSRSDVAAPPAAPDELDGYMDRFVDLYWRVQQEYVHEVEPDEAIYGSIQGMLSTLDPHSSFLDPKTYRRMKESQKGSFSGLGIMVGMRNNLLTVIAPIEGTPASRAGIRAGDVISAIEGDPTADLSLEESVSKLRGPRGSSVTIEIRRAGFEQPLPVTIVRDDIRTRSIEHFFMIRPGVGYIRIKDFTSTTASELDEAIANLTDSGMERLILDLRNNPGGLLDQAVAVAERFLHPGQMVVYTRGRVSHSNAQFTAAGEGEIVQEPLIVLVDGGSASASEIVAGAIQDHDRGLIVGQRTWGKGLVQSVYTLPGDSAMALTTARYYTPAGRLIQRDYTSLYDYFNPDEDKDYSTGPAVHTDLGREVHGGGGITPDVEVEPEEAAQVVQELDLRHQAFFAFSNLLAAADRIRKAPPDEEEGAPAGPVESDPIIQGILPQDGLKPGWRADEKVREAFKAYLEREKIQADPDAVDKAWPQISRILESEVSTAIWGLRAGYRVMIEGDRQVLEALKLFPEAEQLARGDLPSDFPGSGQAVIGR